MSTVAELILLVGILVPAALSPGPNNSIVLHAAVHNGVAASLWLIVAVITGSVALLAMISIGLAIATQDAESIRSFIALIGAAYLAWMGLMMFKSSAVTNLNNSHKSVLPGSFLGVLIFQLINPKSWLMMGIVSAHWSQAVHWTILLVTLTTVFAVCLSCWALAGRVLSHYLTNLHHQAVFDKVMGLSLILFASLMLIQNII